MGNTSNEMYVVLTNLGDQSHHPLAGGPTKTGERPHLCIAIISIEIVIIFKYKISESVNDWFRVFSKSCVRNGH